MRHPRPDPSDHTAFHIYLLDRMDSLTRYMWLLMGLCGTSIGVHYIDPLWHFGVLQFP